MNDKVTRQANDLTPGEKGYARNTVTSAERLEIPADMQDRFCVFQAVDQDVYIRFGGGTVTVDETAVSSVASEVLTEDNTSPHLHVPAGTEKHRRLPAGRFTHFSHKSGATGGKLIFGAATGDGINDDA